METTKSDYKPKRVLKKVKDFENVYDYFSYITTEFGDDSLHYDGYNWTADELFDMYLTGDKEAVWKLAVPESPDYSQLPFVKACYEPPEKPRVKGKFSGQDMVQFPCKPALKTVKEYFQAKRVNDKLFTHPRYMHWWPSRHLDPEFAKLKLIDAKQNFLLTKQLYTESMVEIKKDQEILKNKSKKLREFTITFNDLAYRNLFRKKDSEQKVRMDLELNLQKVREGNRLMDHIKKLMVAREDLRMRNEKMQIYEDYLNSVVECSNKKYENIQQILDRYDAVAFMKKQIVRNHLRDMFEMDTQKGKLMKLISERKDAIRDFNNQMSDLARRYKFVVRRYQHWENAVQRLKKLCNKERAQTCSVEASVWNLYVEMCARKRMPLKEDKNDYKAQLAYILLTIKQYEKILEIAQEKYAKYRATRSESSVSTVQIRKPAKQIEDVTVANSKDEPVCTLKESKGSQTLNVGCVDVATMIWWEDELRLANAGKQPLEEKEPGEGLAKMLTQSAEFQWMNRADEYTESHMAGKSIIQREYSRIRDFKQEDISKRSTKGASVMGLKKSSNKSSLEELKNRKVRSESCKEQFLTKKSTVKDVESKILSKGSTKHSTLVKIPVQKSPKIKKTKEKVEHIVEKNLVSKLHHSPKELSIGSQTEKIEMQDKCEQYELYVTVHVQTMDNAELADEHTALAEVNEELSWLKQARTLNRQLISPSIAVKKSDHPLARDSTISVGSTDSGRNWNDTQADWFYPGEWRATLLNLAAEEDQNWHHPLDRSESTVGELLPTGRHMSIAMKEQNTVRYPSKQIQMSSIIFSDQRMDGWKLGKESIVMGQHRGSKELVLERPGLQETLALTDIGLVQRLQTVLAERELQRSNKEDIEIMKEQTDRKSVWTELLDRITKKIKLAAEEKGEVYLKTKRPTEFRPRNTEMRLEKWTKSTDVKDSKKVTDLHPTEEDDAIQENQEFANVDAWTQTPRDQTDDWVQTLPVKEQYGWSQTDRTDEMTQTEDGDTGKEPMEYNEIGTQTDKLPDART